MLLLLVFRALYGDEPEKLQEVEPVEEKEVKVEETEKKEGKIYLDVSGFLYARADEIKP